MNIYEATKQAMNGSGKIARKWWMKCPSYLDLSRLPVKLIDVQRPDRAKGYWNPTAEDLTAEDWEIVD